MRFNDAFTSFQEQFLVHPDITYLGQRQVGPTLCNDYAIKSNWARFQMPVKFGGIFPEPGQENFQMIWPWDIAFFLRDTAGPFLRVLAQAPAMVHDFFRRSTELPPDQAATQEAAAGIDRNDLWRELFRRLGQDPEFISLRPTEARVCRIIAGVEAPGDAPIVLSGEPLTADDRVIKLIGELAVGLGLILGATGGAFGLVLGIIGVAITIAAAAPPLAPLVVIVAGILIIVVHLGWVLAVVLAIVKLVMDGLLIFSPNPSLLAHPPRAALSVAV